MAALPTAKSAEKTYDLATARYDYPIRTGPPRRTVLVCSHPRSGSTLLGEGLYFAGGLGCPLEYFHAGFRPGIASRWECSTLPEYARAVYQRRTDPTGTLSVKLFWRDMAELAIELAPDRFDGLHDCPPRRHRPTRIAKLRRCLRLYSRRPTISIWSGATASGRRCPVQR
jgi:hypothetical protein